jgi:hypothetical protein
MESTRLRAKLRANCGFGGGVLEKCIVENRLHRRLDVVMNDDQDKCRLGSGPHNLAVLRHIALNVLQKDGEKGSLRGKIKKAGWDEAYWQSSQPCLEMRLPCTCTGACLRGRLAAL